MECEETTLEDLGLKDGDKLLVESESSNTISVFMRTPVHFKVYR